MSRNGDVGSRTYTLANAAIAFEDTRGFLVPDTSLVNGFALQPQRYGPAVTAARVKLGSFLIKLWRRP